MALFSSRTKNYQSSNQLRTLVEAKEWKKVRKYVAGSKCIKESSSSVSPLLLISKSNPPCKIIEIFIKKHPKAIYDVNCDGKSALHLACEYGASPAVTRKILFANTDAASRKDKNGMLPLHLACRSYCTNNDSWISKEAVRESLMQILVDLLQVEPTSIFTEDLKGMCPMEHALVSDLNLDVIQILRNKQISESNIEKQELNQLISN